ncbi:diaminopimelate decarboxylase [Deinococcus radiodurans]|jgi:diaminopimelate decarboxylase (EC 4.1.1.20)|uniref:Diaminopimelate decarboxylase n=1 Tax=Deinococcus radiodurans (strain ATCC 13939 / DSM 20539 / JCM 16871 / CCUG 27074 / LMG 4051 / NBRC 15346 / NCIMB 9279 / VKM B-1422 / R1) TaxID=243230 RepID=DCDA_DEIRA|nr:diaminopimelate decarboxylase [Deinococcus radiodurans]Q9RTK2.1 RecName: Full=Diaminopimelate decarboxylase; Short=DAP decarboxylase; Short=DAPDC [Deinococcus radiodurans R1 = ATCC 13939 = DSM 20539]AAF11313.1 diaminopimelate decarboxylase [Deinococcus radiodurans R1 = ATCC 13939 = DSM 20539]ANC71144.1 diaminopimelate decarboxylase [Deinococcus radiodurans R1 = ATCC 13939 = DSM 20539]QEM71179.1 diaminopimelate decarboxylase [Deinococcus radiodurans]QIP29725.1 diaminopimelate decarboxylase [
MSLSRHALQDAAQRFGTPLYLYDAEELDAALWRVQRAFGDARIFYAMKANPNLNLLRRYAAAGVGFECVSLGELLRAEAAGAGGERMILNGPAKSDAEYAAAARLGATIVVDREEEVVLLPPGSRVLVRVNPAMTVSTHEHLATGTARSKFGLTPEQVPGTLAELRDAGHEVLGLHMHIGSAIEQAEDFTAAFARVTELRAHIGGLSVLNVGGGWSLNADLEGIAYEAHEAARVFGAELWVEPGRYLVASAGWLLTRVVGTKRTGRNFCLVDAGMTEFLRPMLYGASHPLYPMWDALATEVWDVAGPACESGDLIARGVPLPTPQRGHLLLIGEAGAYGASMSSTYLSRPRPAEVLWTGHDWQLLRRRETPQDIWAAEV